MVHLGITLIVGGTDYRRRIYCLYYREKGFETPSSYRQIGGDFAGRHAVPEFDHGICDS